VLSCERKDMKRLAQYIIRNPFSVEKMWATEPGPASASGSIGRNFELFTPCDFIAAITQQRSRQELPAEELQLQPEQAPAPATETRPPTPRAKNECPEVTHSTVVSLNERKS
jgi:hypothetical protein